MNRDHFKLTGVEVGAGASLVLTFADRAEMTVDLQPWIAKGGTLEPLKVQALFRRARVGDGGWSVAWDDEGLLDLASDNLRNLAVEQAGGIGHERIWEWMHRNGLTVEATAAALGISPRMLAYYRSGRKPIPRHVWLACRGWELMPKKERPATRAA